MSRQSTSGKNDLLFDKMGSLTKKFVGCNVFIIVPPVLLNGSIFQQFGSGYCFAKISSGPLGFASNLPVLNCEDDALVDQLLDDKAKSFSSEALCYLTIIWLGCEEIILLKNTSPAYDQRITEISQSYLTFPNYKNETFNIEHLARQDAVVIKQGIGHDSIKSKNVGIYGSLSVDRLAGSFYATQKGCLESNKTSFWSGENVLVNRYSMITDADVVSYRRNMFWALLLHTAPWEIGMQAMQYLGWRLGLQFVLNSHWITPCSKNSNIHDNDSRYRGSALHKLDHKLVGFEYTGRDLEHMSISLSRELQGKFGLQNSIDLSSWELWFRSLESLNYNVPEIPPKVALVVRTFAGDIKRLNQYLVPSIEMFVDKSEVEVIFVFDETEADFAVASCFSREYGYTIFHEAWPKNHSEFLRGIAFKHLSHLKNKNYGKIILVILHNAEDVQ